MTAKDFRAELEEAELKYWDQRYRESHFKRLLALAENLEERLEVADIAFTGIESMGDSVSSHLAHVALTQILDIESKI